MARERLTPILWAYVDVLHVVVAGLLIALVLIAAKKPTDPTKETDRSAGDISVFLFWPDGDSDVDTWLRSPDGDVVSFTHKSGSVWSLLRDDLGWPNDQTPHNFENSYARGLPAGEYAVTAHMYRNNGAFPIQVDAELRIKPDHSTSPVVFNAHVMLDHVGDEGTLFRFSIDGQGNLVPGSVNNQSVTLARPDK